MPFILLLALLSAFAAGAPARAALALDPHRQYDISITSRFNTQQRLPKNLRDFLKTHPNVHLRQWDGIRMPAEGARASLAMAMAATSGGHLRDRYPPGGVARPRLPAHRVIGQDGVLANGTPKRKRDGTPDLKRPHRRQRGALARLDCRSSRSTARSSPSTASPTRSPTAAEPTWASSTARRSSAAPASTRATRRAPGTSLPAGPAFSTTTTPGFPASSSSRELGLRPLGAHHRLQHRGAAAPQPTTGLLYTFGEQATDLCAPDTGEDLQRVTPSWRCNVASPAAAAAVGFYHRLRWAPWVRDAATGEPVELSEADVARAMPPSGPPRFLRPRRRRRGVRGRHHHRPDRDPEAPGGATWRCTPSGPAT